MRRSVRRHTLFLRALPVLLVVVAAGSWHAAVAVEDEPEKVRAAFLAYRDAHTAGDGAKMASTVTRGTLAYYDTIRELALHAPKDKVRALPKIDQIHVLWFRQVIPRETLRQKSGQELFADMVGRGFRGPSGLMLKMDVTGIKVNDSHASATLQIEKEDTAAVVDFLREDGVWKIDLTPENVQQQDILASAAAQSGKSEEDFIVDQVATRTSAKVRDDIWEPLAPEGSGQ